MNAASEIVSPLEGARTGRAVASHLRRILSFPVFLGVLLFAGAYFGTLSEGTKADTLFGEGDTWWHIRAGDEILRTHHFPHADSYSWTATGTDWIAYEWLGEVAMAGAYRAGGLRGLKLMQLGLTGGILTLLYWYAAMRSGSSKAAFVVCTVIVPIMGVFGSLRPQLIGYACFLLTLIVLEWFRRGRDAALWFLPPIFLLWVNTHGTFVFGLIAAGLVWVCAMWRFPWRGIENTEWTPARRASLGIAMLASVVALCVTPYGTRLAAYPLDIGFLQPTNIASIQEWMPVTTERFLAIVVFALLTAFFVSRMLMRLESRMEDLVLVAGTALLAVTHLRFVPLFLIVCAPLLAAALARWLPAYDAAKDRPLLNAGLIAALAAGMWLATPTTAELEKIRAARFPVAAVEYLRAHPEDAPLLNDYGWGGYLDWAHVPARGVFIDGRADVFERAGALAHYLKITRLEPGAFGSLKSYGIRACLLRPDAALATTLRQFPNWEEVYGDSVSVIFVRRDDDRVGTNEGRMGAKRY